MERHGCQHHKHLAAGPFALPGAERHYPPDLRVAPVHLALEMRLDLAAERADGICTLHLLGRGAGDDRVALNAVGFSDVAVEPVGGPELTWRYDGEELTIYWETPIREGEERVVRVEYRVEHPVTGLFFSRPTEQNPDAPWFAATDNETERARYWLPTVDQPSVRPTLEIALRAEERFTALANGALVGEERHPDGTRTTRWRLEHPCPSYLTCFVVGDLVEHVEPPLDGLPIAFYTTRDHSSADLQRSFGKTREMLAWMTEKLGVPFPYPKYYQFALPGFGGAMENISLVSWDDMFVMDEVLETEFSRVVDQVNVHEMAHSWFGDLVVCRDFAHAWLKESWATYMEQCWFEDAHGRDEADYEFSANAHAYFFEADTRYARPLVTREFNSSWQMYDRHLYPGGACRLHMLRHVLGDAVFWQGVRLYLERNAGLTVETDHFRHTLEEVSGRALGSFFDQWVHGVGYPRLKASSVYDPPSRRLAIEIEQLQVNAPTSWPTFEFEIEVGWVIDGVTHTRGVKVDGGKHVFTQVIDRDPDQVRIDPMSKVLHWLEFNPGDDKLKAQLTGAPDVNGRILAARELVGTGKRTNIEAVATAYVGEPFWGVRLQMAWFVSSSNTASAVEALSGFVRFEEDPRVLAGLFNATTGVRDPAIADAIAARIDGDLPHRAKRAALEALGAQRRTSDVSRLTEACAQVGFGGLAQSGAFVGLARLRQRESLTELLAALAPGAAPENVRPAVASAVGILGHWLDGKGERTRAVEALVDRLRDANERVQIAAARALASMDGTEAIAALESYGRGLSNQHRTTVRQIVDGMRSAAASKPGALQDEIGKLREELRRLADRVERAESRLDAPMCTSDEAAT